MYLEMPWKQLFIRKETQHYREVRGTKGTTLRKSRSWSDYGGPCDKLNLGMLPIRQEEATKEFKCRHEMIKLVN